MQLLSKLWNNSPKAVFRWLCAHIFGRVPKPRWEEVKSGPLRGAQLYVASNAFGGWADMLNGRFDSFIYEEVSRLREIRGAVVWDVGAHFGYHSFSFASLVGDSGHVYSFEPNPFNLARFKMHLEKNGKLAKRITLNAFALSDVNAELSFIFSNDVDGSSSSGSHLQNVGTPLKAEAYSNFKTQAVPAMTIDSILDRPDVRPPDIIKVDVEGAEALVLKGGGEFFRKHKPIIFMEVHNVLMMHSVYDFLSKLGYSVRLLDENNATLSKCFIVAHSV